MLRCSDLCVGKHFINEAFSLAFPVYLLGGGSVLFPFPMSKNHHVPKSAFTTQGEPRRHVRFS